MPALDHPALHRLWQLAGGSPDDPGADWNPTFDPVGLILLAPPRHRGFWCTPVGALTFAETGGDSVHYSLLPLNGRVGGDSPVVMTVPMCDTPNTVVGADLTEFLALGCCIGYFALEQLVYDPDATLRELETRDFDPEADDEQRERLIRISSEFGLEPWPDPARRLGELHNLYLPMVQVLPDPD